MKKIFLFLFVMFMAILPVLAEQPVLKSETGIIENIDYIDMDGESNGQSMTKQLATVKVLTGEFKGSEQLIENVITNNPAYDMMLSKGDKVILHLEAKDEVVGSEDDVDFFIADFKRDTTLYWLGAIFFAGLLLVGRLKGLLSFISIFTTVAMIFFILMPLILYGVNPILAAILVCILATIVTIYIVAGFNRKSTSAVIGSAASLIFAGIIAIIAINFAHLTGFAGEETMFLYSARPDLDFTGILTASMMLATLGAVMDIGVSIASTINELYQTNTAMTTKELFKSGMNVGCDIIGTMANTLILVYLGSALPLVLLANNIDLQKFFNLNQVATEIVSALIGSIGILACVPLTAIVSAILIRKKKSAK